MGIQVIDVICLLAFSPERSFVFYYPCWPSREDPILIYRIKTCLTPPPVISSKWALKNDILPLFRQGVAERPIRLIFVSCVLQSVDLSPLTALLVSFSD